MALRLLAEAPVEGKRVLVRVDFNVPFTDGRVSDDTRLRASLPTIRHLCERGAKVVLCSHLGRPKGGVDEALRLGTVAQRLGELLDCSVGYVQECIGPQVAAAVHAMAPEDVLLLENLRFHPGEEKNDSAFARDLASVADLFVNDAFGAAHRAHASTVGITKLLPSYAGFLLEKEAEMLGAVLHDPQRPFAVVVGGAKISDKLPVLESLLDKVDVILIGGGMVATFFRPRGTPAEHLPKARNRSMRPVDSWLRLRPGAWSYSSPKMSSLPALSRLTPLTARCRPRTCLLAGWCWT